MTNIFLEHYGTGRYLIYSVDDIVKDLFSSYNKYSVKIWMNINNLTYDRLIHRNRSYLDNYRYYTFKLKTVNN